MGSRFILASTSASQAMSQLWICLGASSHALSATERIKDTGTNDVDLEIRITHSADDASRDEHVTMCGEILEAITGTGDLVTFNQTVDFHIYDIYPVSSQMEMDGRNWSTVISIQIVGLARNGFVAP
jgi:hypothetical protein